MTKLNLENYFTNQKIYDPRIIITIIEDITGKPFRQIKEDINNQKITVTKEQIKEYLEKKFIEEEPETKKRIEAKQQDLYNPNWQEEEQNIKALSISQEFVDHIIAAKYDFDPYTIEYFKKYTAIVKRKLILLLDLIEKISIKDTKPIQDLLTDLDINLDTFGNIAKDDIIRLIKPTIDNLNDLDEKVQRANNLATYLTFTIQTTNFYENNIYPSSSLQIKSPFHDHLKGNVPLSPNQKEELEKKQRKSMHTLIKSLLD